MSPLTIGRWVVLLTALACFVLLVLVAASAFAAPEWVVLALILALAIGVLLP